MIVSRRHLGTTRSGKRVCVYDTEDLQYVTSQIEGYSWADNFDAHCIFEFLIVVATRQLGVSAPGTMAYAKMSDLHKKLMPQEFIEREKKSLSLPTSIALAEHGKSLIPSFLKD